MPASAREPSTFAEAISEIESRPTLWLASILPHIYQAPFASHHLDFWNHVWTIDPHVRPRPFIGLWARGGGKSSSAEGAVAALGVRRKRRYAWYVHRTQEDADEHVDSIGAMLESPYLAAWYPDMANRMVGKYNQSKGWRRSRLRTAAGFTVDSIGIDKAARGRKVEDQRPDLIVFDDIDSDNDTPAITDRLARLIAKKILPAGSNDVAVIFIQNLVHADSVAARLAGLGTKPVDFLANRVMSGPIPAVRGLEVEQTPDGYRVTAGTPTWEGQNLDVVQAQITDWGYSTFLAEAQHEEQPPEGGIFGHLDFDSIEVDAEQVPLLQRLSTWCDVAVTDTDRSDAQAVQIDGLGVDGKVYRLFSWEQRSSPVAALTVAITKTVELGGGFVGVETDQGGDAWQSVFREARTIVANRAREEGQNELAARVEAVTFREEKAGAGYGPKAARAGRMVAWYERGAYRHVRGTHTTLTRALQRFGLRKPYDLCLVPETPVLTDAGWVRLDSLRVGTLVMTRDGWRPVERVGPTATNERLLRLVVGGLTLTGTANHPVWTDNRGWVELGEIRRGDMVQAWRAGEGRARSTAVTGPTTGTGSAIPIGGSGRNTATLSLADPGRLRVDEKSSGSTATPTTATPTPSSKPTACTSPQAARTPTTATSCIATFGAQRTGRSRRAWLFTMWTAIISTTIRRTSLSSPMPSTDESTGRRGRTPTPWQPIWSRCVPSLSNGTGRMKAGPGTASTGDEHGKAKQRTGNSSASNAASRSALATTGAFVSALRSAATRYANARTARTASARGAAGRSQPTGTTSSGFVAVRVSERPRPAGVGDVWNLTVSDSHEFVAGGLLVHNCDASWWCCNDLLETGSGGSSASLLRR